MPDTADFLVVLVALLFLHQLFMHQGLEKFMSDFHQQFQEFRNAVDIETTRLADLFEKLIKKADAVGLTDEEMAEANETLRHMRAIGTSPQNPLPEAPATPAIDSINEGAPGTSGETGV